MATCWFPVRPKKQQVCSAPWGSRWQKGALSRLAAIYRARQTVERETSLCWQRAVNARCASRGIIITIRRIGKLPAAAHPTGSIGRMPVWKKELQGEIKAPEGLSCRALAVLGLFFHRVLNQALDTGIKNK